MSMLSSQADKLREKADKLHDMGMADTPALLREAADTILSLRERAQECATCTERQGYYLDAETIQNQQEHIAELKRERDYWKRECADMLSEFWDTESEHCAMLDYPRPASEPAPSVMVMASRMGNGQYREEAEKRIAELTAKLEDAEYERDELRGKLEDDWRYVGLKKQVDLLKAKNGRLSEHCEHQRVELARLNGACTEWREVVREMKQQLPYEQPTKRVREAIAYGEGYIPGQTMRAVSIQLDRIDAQVKKLRDELADARDGGLA